MDDNQLERTLRSIGMRVFVEYFDYFADSRIPAVDMIERLFQQENFTEKSCRSRTGHARSIIRSGRSSDALRLVVDSTRVEASIKKRAEQLLKKLNSD